MCKLYKEVLEKIEICSVATRLPTPIRTSAKAQRDGVKITSQEIELYSRDHLKALVAIRANIYRECGQIGTKLDVLNAYAVTTDRVETLAARLEKHILAWETEQAAAIAAYPSWIEAQCQAYPAFAEEIRTIAETPEEFAAGIRIIWARFPLAPSDSRGLEDEILSLPQQAAHEIALDIRQSTGSGSRYSKRTLEVLRRVADKAASLSFMSEELGAIKPAVEQLIASLPVSASYTGNDALRIGALLAYLSDPRRILAKGANEAEEEEAVPYGSQDPGAPQPIEEEDALVF